FARARRRRRQAPASHCGVPRARAALPQLPRRRRVGEEAPPEDPARGDARARVAAASAAAPARLPVRVDARRHDLAACTALTSCLRATRDAAATGAGLYFSFCQKSAGMSCAIFNAPFAPP